MQGTVSPYSLVEAFRAIYTERRSGELLLRNGQEEKHIFFERGQVVFASSNRPEDRIGEILIRYKKLTREQIDGFVAQLAPGQRMGRALVETGVISERELISYVTLQIMDMVNSLFRWHQGSYTFINAEGRAPEELKMKLSTATLILEGVRRIEDFDTIRRGIGSPALMLVPTPAGRSKFQAIAFSPLELNLINMIKEPMDLLKVIVSCKERPEKVLQAVYGLLAIGLLEQADDQQVAAKLAHVSSETGAHSAVTGGFAAVSEGISPVDANLIAEIETMKRRISTKDVCLILGISPDMNVNEIYDVYLKLAMRFHPEKFSNVSANIKSDIDKIFTAVTESYNYIRTNGVPPPPAGIAPPPPQPQPPAYGNPAQGYPGYPPQQRMAPTGSYPSAPPQYGAPGYPTGGYYPQQAPPPPPPSPMSARTAVTRAVSDELEFKSANTRDRDPLAQLRRGVDVEKALNEMLDYFDDRRAMLFASESLTILFRTKPPQHIGKRELAESIISWGRSKAAAMGWPLPSVLLRVLGLIKQAEQAQLISDFDGSKFYNEFIQELASYCSPPEADELRRGVAGL